MVEMDMVGLCWCMGASCGCQKLHAIYEWLRKWKGMFCGHPGQTRPCRITTPVINTVWEGLSGELEGHGKNAGRDVMGRLSPLGQCEQEQRWDGWEK